MKISVDFFRKCVMFSIVMMPILDIYQCPGVPSIGLGEILAVFLLLLDFSLKLKLKITLHYNSYYGFILYAVFISLVLTALIPEYSLLNTLTRLARLIFYTLYIFETVRNNSEWNTLADFYLKVCIFASFYLIAQFLVKMGTGIYLPSTIGPLKIMNSYLNGTQYNDYLNAVLDYSYRPTSFFIEPAHFCRYVIYSVPILILDPRYNNRLIKAIMVVTAILISQSAIGYFMLAAVGGYWIFFTRESRNGLKTILMFLSVVAFIWASIEFGLLDKALWRVEGLGESRASDATVRILRGFVIFDKMPVIFKIIGSGFGNFAEFSSAYDISTYFDMGLVASVEQGDEYMSFLGGLFVYVGIIGFLLFTKSFLELRIKNHTLHSFIYLIFLVAALSSNIKLYSSEFALVVSMILCSDSLFYINKEVVNENEKL